jgi:shikimate 5-dehydrogenase
MMLYPEYRQQITCLPLDPDRVTVLGGGGVAQGATVEVTDTDREGVTLFV